MNKYMKLALKEAENAYFDNNVPVGAVIVKDNEVLASFYNTKNTSKIAINHAEILCIVEACKKLNSWYLNECELYVTLKPCSMCIAAIAEARIRKVYYLIDSNYDKNMRKNMDNVMFEKIEDENDYSKLLSLFFKDKR